MDQTEAQTHGWLRWAPTAWVLVVLFGLGVLVIAIPLHLSELRVPLVEGSRNLFNMYQLTPQEVGVLDQFGLSLDLYVAFILSVELVWILMFCLPALVLVLRRPRQPMTMYVAFMLTVSGLFSTPIMWPIATRFSSYGISPIVTYISFVPVVVFLFIFPDGRFVPRWTRVLVTAMLVATLGLALISQPGISGGEFDMPVLIFLLFLPFGVGAAVQVYRFRRVSNPIERQQTKWVCFGIVGAVVMGGIQGLIAVYAIYSASSSLGYVLYHLISVPLPLVSLGLLPIAITLAVLRYRLWDIDVVVRKTLVYAVLTGLLALVYFGSVVLMQTLFSRLTGIEQSALAVVVSTLIIAALFNPLRRRIQDAIDRRFYRKKYNAQQVLAQFAQTARDETDLDALLAELVRVVDETLQPEHVSVWLRDSSTPKS